MRRRASHLHSGAEVLYSYLKMARYFTDEEEAQVKAWFERNRLQGEIATVRHNLDGKPDTIRVMFTLKPGALPLFMRGPPARTATAA